MKNLIALTARPAVASSALLTAASSAWAHDGHGLTGSHWHTADSLGFVGVAILAAAALWLSHKK